LPPRPLAILLAAVCLAFPATASGATANRAAVEAREKAADEMVEQLNRARQREGMRKFKVMPALARSARGYANRLMSADAFFHRSPLPTPGGIVQTGEVLGIHTGRNNAIRSTLRTWLQSSAHRSIVLDSSMNRVGAGIAKGIFQGRAQSIWVVQVGRR
jgi:uncharacterized protein YkwD